MSITALILVDIQDDFLPGGALAVPNGDQVIEIANQHMTSYDLVVATQDWHPADHLSFASMHPGNEVGDQVTVDGLRQILWPTHCVQGTNGARLAVDLNRSSIDQVFQKGTDQQIDSYSGFFDNARRGATGLEEYLRSKDVREVHVMGLALDYCVKFTALDACDLGFNTVLLASGCRGVNLTPGDCDAAIAEMRGAGVVVQQTRRST